jgi:hypothetical protein
MPADRRILNVRRMDITTQQAASAERVRTGSSRAVGVVGLAATVLVFTGVNLQDVGRSSEPPFNSSDSVITDYLTSRNMTVFSISAYLTVVGMIGLVWFTAGLSGVLRRASPGRDWMPAVVLAAGATMIGILLGGNWEVAIRYPRSPAAVEFFRSGGLQLSNAWLAMASIALAAAVTILRGRIAPTWLGWWAVVAGVGLIAVRAMPDNNIWLFPYLLFWVWVVIVCVRLLTGRQI